jgi:photosystem II stability/assembly factor-like uncharacterized protein
LASSGGGTASLDVVPCAKPDRSHDDHFRYGTTVGATSTTKGLRGEGTGNGQLSAYPISVFGQIICTSQKKCLAVADSITGQPIHVTTGIVLRTSDGGIHWADLHATRNVSFDALACPSAQSCVAFGGKPVGNNFSGIALRTTEGGRTWETSTLPRGVGEIAGVSCATTTFCMAVGASPDGSAGEAIVRTKPTGQWKSLALPDGEKSLALVSCPARNDCIAVGGGPSGGGTTISTTNGGESWEQSSLPHAFAEISISESISCPSTTHCLVVGNKAPGDGNPSGVAFVTSDGGKLWMSQTVPADTTYLNDITCRTTSNCVVVGGGILPRGGLGAGTVLTTTDGGATWTPGSVPATTGGLYSVSCPTLEFSPVGTDPRAFTTSDGGGTWSTIASE